MNSLIPAGVGSDSSAAESQIGSRNFPIRPRIRRIENPLRPLSGKEFNFAPRFSVDDGEGGYFVTKANGKFAKGANFEHIGLIRCPCFGFSGHESLRPGGFIDGRCDIEVCSQGVIDPSFTLPRKESIITVTLMVSAMAAASAAMVSVFRWSERAK